jgi:ketosteroid isomerase-like protein
VSVAEAISAFRAVQRRLYAGQVGEDALARVLTADVVWHVPGANALAGDHRGRDAVLRYFTLRRAMADATLRITVHGEAEVGDLVVTRADGVAVVDGRNAAWRTVGIYRTAGDRVAECWMVPLDQRRFDRVWRSPVDTLLANSVVRHRLVRIVRAPVAAVDSGLRAVTPGDMPVARALFAMRSLPLRLRGRSGLPTADDEPFVDAMVAGGLSRLVDRPGAELAFGLIGQPWRPSGGTTVQAGPVDEFAGFDRAGFVKVVERFRFAPISDTDTVVIDELAARCTDAVSARQFRRYWRVVALGSRLVRRQLLDATARLAESADTAQP